MFGFLAGCCAGFASALMLCSPRTAAEDPDLRLRDPEDRCVDDVASLREKMMDKTLADSYPASDPPSSIPDPSADDSLAA